MADDDIEVPADLPVAGTSASDTSEPLAQPEKDAPSTGTEQPDEKTTTASEATDDKSEPEASEDKPAEKKPPWFVERLARQREELARERQEKQEYFAKLQAYERQLAEHRDPNHPQQNTPSAAELQHYVRVEAARMAEQREMQQKLSSFDNAGRSAYPDFVDRCNTLASLGAAENPIFMQTITAMDDGHKVVAQLAENPQKAIEILSLPPISMAVALARFAHQTPRPPPLSKAPSPVRPIHGQAHVDPDASKMSDAEWFRKFPGGAGAQSKG